MKSANLLLVLSALVVSSSSGRDYPGTDYRSNDQCSCVHVNQCNDPVIRSTQGRVYIGSRGGQKLCVEDSQVCCRNEFVVGTTPLKQKLICGVHNRQRYLPYPTSSYLRELHELLLNKWTHKEFPWTVAVMREEWGLYDTYLGGGALIHPQVVVTAAHLVKRKRSMKSIIVKHPTQDLKVAQVIIHEEFNNENLENDIALLILKEPVNMTNPNVGLICLPEANQSMEGRECVSTGWSDYSDHWSKQELHQRSLKKTTMVMKSKNKCKSLKNFGHESFLCGHGVLEQSYCEWQSGSPLLCPSLTEKDVYVLAGIVMRRNYPCGSREPGVYANVSHFVNWINGHLAATSIDQQTPTEKSTVYEEQPVGINIQTIIDNQKRQNIFDAELLQSVSLKEKGNFLVSPVSVKALLSLVIEGAAGQTLNKMLDVLKLPQDIKIVRSLLTVLQNVLQIKPTNHISAILDLHSHAFVSKRYKINSTYKRTLKSVYQAEVTSQDFSSPNVAANVINRWINDQTRGMIPQLIEAASISPDTLAILVSAVYFKGVWKTTFLERDTKTRCFYSEPSFECQNVPTMFLTEDLPYKFDEKLDAHILQIPYEDERFSMVLVVPKEKEGMQQLQSQASSLSVPDLLNKTKYIEVELHLPRFTIEHKTDLKSVLGDLGLEEIFTDSAQLPFIVNNMPGKVSEMVQKAKIEVSENGTKASAASEASVVPLSYSETVYLNVDRPFYYFIFEEVSQTVLFSGRLSSMAETTDSVLGAGPQQSKRGGNSRQKATTANPYNDLFN